MSDQLTLIEELRAAELRIGQLMDEKRFRPVSEWTGRTNDYQVVWLADKDQCVEYSWPRMNDDSSLPPWPTHFLMIELPRDVPL